MVTASLFPAPPFTRVSLTMAIYNDALRQYIVDTFVPADPALDSIPRDSVAAGLPAISIRPDEGQFLQLLVRACGARRALEIGTLGGYSGSWIARGLPADGQLTTLELEPHHAEVARRHFARAGVGDKVTVVVGSAHDLLPGLASEAPWDFVFIDAEKSGYGRYFDWAVAHTRPGALIVAHNAFRDGKVLAGAQADPGTQAIIAFNRQVAGEARVHATIYPGGDGMTVAVRR